MRKDIPFDTLKIKRPYRVFRKGRDGVVGLDCESLVTGYAFLVTDSLGRYKWIRGADDVVEFLDNYGGSYNTFFNMDFDVTVMLKWFGKEFCKQLLTREWVRYKGVAMRYVPRRFFILRNGNKWSVFNDVSQYYIGSLDYAAKNYLNDAKVHVGTKSFDESFYGDERTLRYCIHDSELGAGLTQQLICDLHDMGFAVRSLSSPGTIVSEAFSNIPDITKIPRGALEYAYNSYRGGWMECFKRGYFKRLYDYDVSSAYPYQVGELIDLDGGKWTYRKGEPVSAGIGFVRCSVHITSHISPIFFHSDVNYTPTGVWQTYLTLDEVLFVRQHKLGTVRVLDGWYFTPSKGARRPFHYGMRRLFRQRERIRNVWLPKSLSVAMYGKFAQRDEDGNTGELFNPVYAALITARTRLQMAEYALIQPESLVLVINDGLAFDKPLPYDVLGKGLGKLRLDAFASAVVVGTNVYTMKGVYKGGPWRPGRFDWLKLLDQQPDTSKFALKHFRYTTMAEGIEGDWDKVGVFDNFDYEFNVNFDHKRLFKKVTRGGDLLTSQYGSIPWEVGIVKRRHEKLWALQ